MRFTLRQLEVFVAVAQHESVSRAARVLSLSQSAASTALAELEKQFDCQLLDRIGKRLKLNALGFQLLPKAVALLDRAEEVEELLRGRQGIGTLDVGATLTIGNYLATLLIGDFMQRFPGSRVRLAVRNTRTIIEEVRHHELDLGLIEGHCEAEDVITQPWVEDELSVFCSPRHPLAGSGPVPLERLLREAWIMREEGSGRMSKNILDSNISYAYSDKVLDPCPWGLRVYYYGCEREGGDSGWLRDNLDQAPGHPAFHGLTALWTFDGKWDPEARIRDLWYVLKYQTK